MRFFLPSPVKAWADFARFRWISIGSHAFPLTPLLGFTAQTREPLQFSRDHKKEFEITRDHVVRGFRQQLRLAVNPGMAAAVCLVVCVFQV